MRRETRRARADRADGGVESLVGLWTSPRDFWTSEFRLMPHTGKTRHVAGDLTTRSAAVTRRRLPYRAHHDAMSAELPELTVADCAEWRAWLGEHHGRQAGIWLVMAKKGTTSDTTLTYEQAVEEALCHGWIDGQARRRDQATYSQRFTPRRARSNWSQSNLARLERLIAAGRMRPPGMAEVERAKADGRWPGDQAGQDDRV